MLYASKAAVAAPRTTGSSNMEHRRREVVNSSNATRDVGSPDRRQNKSEGMGFDNDEAVRAMKELLRRDNIPAQNTTSQYQSSTVQSS